MLERTPTFRGRIFGAGEIVRCERAAEPARSFAACFAAKEALLKALGIGASGLDVWTEVEVRIERGLAVVALSGALRERARHRGVDAANVSLSERGPLVIAAVLLEGSD